MTKIFDMFSYIERYLTCTRIHWVLHRYETIFCDKHICDILLYWEKLSEHFIWYVYFFNILPVGFSLVLVTCYKVYMSMCIFVCFNIIDYISFSTHDHNCYFLLQSIKHCFPKKIVTFFPEGMIYYAISTLILTTQDKYLQIESVHWLEVNVMLSDAQTIFTQEQGMSYLWRNRINSVVG